MPNLVHGQDPGGALRPIQVDENGNLSVDIVSGVSVSTSISGTMTVDQLSGSVWSTAVVNGATTLDVKQVSGSIDSVSVVNADSLSVVQASGSVNSINILQVAGTSVAANSGVANDGTLRVVHVTDVALSSQVTGAAAHDAAVAGNPVLGGGEARTTNPTAVTDGDAVRSVHDDLGRQVITPYQVRDLLSTAYITTTTGIETTLLAAGGAGVFLDLMQIVCANQSDAAVDVDFRSVTAGNVEFSLTVPADSTAGFIPVIPYPQGNPNNNWTADVAGADVSGTTVNISALFIKNI